VCGPCWPARAFAISLRQGGDADRVGAAIAPVVAELPERERTMLSLRLLEDLTQNEIAKRIGVSQMQVSRILRAIRERLAKHVPAPAET
jgi:RNA polymerase sigma factor (sigma-70 family)